MATTRRRGTVEKPVEDPVIPAPDPNPTVACMNCGQPAFWYIEDGGVSPLDLCDACLPRHWRRRAMAGHFQDSQKVDPAHRAEVHARFNHA